MMILEEKLMISLKMLEMLLKLHKCKFIHRLTYGMLCFFFKRKIVDTEDWKEIDEKQRKRRLTPKREE